MNHAVNNTYAELIPADSFPSYFLNIEIDPKEIDINIHTTKTEINFRDAKYVYAVMQAAVKQSIGQYSLTPTIDFDVDPAIELVLGNRPKEGVKQPEISINPEYNPFKQKKDADFEIPHIDKKKTKNWEELYKHHLPKDNSTEQVEKADDNNDFELKLEQEPAKF